MVCMNIEQLNPVQIAIITLLRADDKNKLKYSPIPGFTHLVKELFAIKKTKLGNKLLDELRFEPDNFGPFDEAIYAALEELKNVNLVSVNTTNKNSQIKLTISGREISDQIWAKLKGEIASLFTYTKTNYNHLSSEELLERIYAAYPEMTTYSLSKVAIKYKNKGMS